MPYQNNAYQNYLEAKKEFQKARLTAFGFAGISLSSILLWAKLNPDNWTEYTIKKFEPNVFVPPDSEPVISNIRITPAAGITPGSHASQRLIAFAKEKAKFNFDGACAITRCGDRFFHNNRTPNAMLVSLTLVATAVVSGFCSIVWFMEEVVQAENHKDRCKAALYD